MSSHDPAQWIVIGVLLMVSFTCLGLALSNMRLSNKVYSISGKVDLITETYTKTFQRMHERLTELD